jgi:hypothetical protein
LIQENILLAKKYKEKLGNSSEDRDSNRIPQKTGAFIPLRERLTVCVDEKCTEIIDDNGEQRINYKSNCHVGCSLHRVVQECIGHPIIKRCRALRKTGLSIHFIIDFLFDFMNLIMQIYFHHKENPYDKIIIFLQHC